jgi:hypothetical protein
MHKVMHQGQYATSHALTVLPDGQGTPQAR